MKAAAEISMGTEVSKKIFATFCTFALRYTMHIGKFVVVVPALVISDGSDDF